MDINNISNVINADIPLDSNNNQINISKFLKQTKIDHKENKYKIYLDSEYSPDFKWDVVRDKVLMRNDTVYIPDYITEITAIEIENFYVDVPYNLQYLKYDYDMHQILVNEFVYQSFINNNNFHFNTLITNKIWYNNLKYIFQHKIKLEETISLRLLEEFEYTDFPTAPYYTAPISNLNPLRLLIPKKLSENIDFKGAVLTVGNIDVVSDYNILVEKVQNYVIDDYKIIDGVIDDQIELDINIGVLGPIANDRAININFYDEQYRIKYTIPLILYYS